MSESRLASETQEELDQQISGEKIVVDWIDDEYEAEISAATGDEEFMNVDADSGTDTGADAGAETQGEDESAGSVQALLNSFDCRRPVYSGIWLYYYAGCNGVFSRIRRNRVRSIIATGFCGVPTRRFKVFYN